ncbi:MAG: zinc carboxypeptidase [Elusimicrobia bacterium]|nr:zinc carboxypeptidase [Elusimicrobiota bacterium]
MKRLLGLAVFAAALSASASAGGLWEALFDGGSDGSSGAFSSFVAKLTGEAASVKPVKKADDRYWVTLRIDGKAARTQAASLGLSIESVEGSAVSGVADLSTLKRLQDAGMQVQSRRALAGFRPEDFPPADGIYHNYGEIVSEMQSVASAGSGFASMFSVGTSVQGRAIPGLRLGYPSRDGHAKPAAAFLGAHHAREHLSTEVPLLLARWIAEHAREARVKRLLETRDIYILPVINPDGVEYDIAAGSYRWQRKNLKDNGDGSVGVDLNRNYDFRFGGEGASDYPGSDTYHGPSAFSEPETRAVRSFVEALPNLKVMVSYHTFSELVMYPWGGADEPISDGRALAAFKAMAERAAQWTGYRAMQSSELYVATGDTCDWAWAAKGIFCLTFELTPKSQGQGGFYPGSGAVGPTVQKNIEPALYLIDLADDPFRAANATAMAAPAETSL